MARRTKEDALATRHQLLDAAERVFAEKGVSRTSLNDIAQAAGASRGAIYWHFKNKADLFNAMLERITLPMEQALHQCGQDGETDAGRDSLRELQDAIFDAMRKIASDERTRRVFEVATHKVEYIDELLAVKERQVQSHANAACRMHYALQDARARRGLQPLAAPAAAAHGLHALVVGLIQSWLLAPEMFDLVSTAEIAVGAYLSGLGLQPLQA
jgi:TetR/AcrR family acrAB operon transcriptional repressor